MHWIELNYKASLIDHWMNPFNQLYSIKICFFGDLNALNDRFVTYKFPVVYSTSFCGDIFCKLSFTQIQFHEREHTCKPNSFITCIITLNFMIFSLFFINLVKQKFYEVNICGKQCGVNNQLTQINMHK